MLRLAQDNDKNKSGITAIQQGVDTNRSTVTRLTADVTSVLTLFCERLLEIGNRVKSLEPTNVLNPQMSMLVFGSLALGVGTTPQLHVQNVDMESLKNLVDKLCSHVNALEEFNCVCNEQGLQESVWFLGHTFMDMSMLKRSLFKMGWS